MVARATLSAALQAHGLHVRGGFCPDPPEGLQLPDGRAAAVVWLVGNVGGSLWDAFAASPFAHDGQPHPLDRWSRHVGDALAQQCGGLALYPFTGPPEQPAYHPFQQWAARSEAVYTSPLMLRIHPQYGLWHAYRFALAMPTLEPVDRDALRAPVQGESPCLHCENQPCLTACPVDAFDGRAFDVQRCISHLNRPAGADCMADGCQARNACPVAAELRYAPAQKAFHMAAFAQARL
ncbi:MAG: ferredoxin [Betaproteobacteria bacterium]|nr:ferredoxin [Betaproteobacteria bacterium]